VSEPQLPALDEAFAQSFGVKSGSLDDLRTEVRQNLELELKRKVEGKVKDQVFQGLRAQADFALPKALVEEEARGLMQRMAANLREQGVKAEDIRLTPEIFTQQAQERVALGLVVAELVRSESLQAKPDQVKALVREAAQTYEQPEAVVRWHYEKPERLADFENMAVEHNVVEWVLGKAQVKDVPTSFEALMGPAKG
jgi:trigger factor